MSASTPKSASPTQPPNWENTQPLGVYKPLTPRLSLGQLSSQLHFIQPLGVRSLSVLKPDLFSSDQPLATEA
ncbi:MAG: hypothetical protein QNJ46_22905, partial [Leptolyngbyaceae cyanobacterium MO_188.B28]|nr:hypothetical protein [Leptolyngbyaceae cyanobacterium MO_188.B28]